MAEPINFKSANTTFTGGKGIGDLPAYKGSGMIITRWRMSWRERLSVLFYGMIWVAVIGEKQPPIAIHGNQDGEFTTG